MHQLDYNPGVVHDLAAGGQGVVPDGLRVSRCDDGLDQVPEGVQRLSSHLDDVRHVACGGTGFQGSITGPGEEAGEVNRLDDCLLAICNAMYTQAKLLQSSVAR